ncbi:hypothetical protein ACS3SW_04310 [Roseobacteraceae bacterium S113]
MADIDELQRRIRAALQRIDTAAENLGQSGGSDAAAEELEATKQALEDEKLASAQLEERLKTLKEKHAEELEDARAQSAGQSEAMAQVDVELQRLRKVITQLRENNAALREANTAGVGEPHLINKAMLAELEALRAERAADVAEASAILSALEPVVNQGAEQGEAS